MISSLKAIGNPFPCLQMEWVASAWKKLCIQTHRIQKMIIQFFKDYVFFPYYWEKKPSVTDEDTQTSSRQPQTPAISARTGRDTSTPLASYRPAQPANPASHNSFRAISQSFIDPASSSTNRPASINSLASWVVIASTRRTPAAASIQQPAAAYTPGASFFETSSSEFKHIPTPQQTPPPVRNQTKQDTSQQTED